MAKNAPAMQETRVRSLCPEDALEKEMATHSSILACIIPWTEEPGGLQSIGSQLVGHDWGNWIWVARNSVMIIEPRFQYFSRPMIILWKESNLHFLFLDIERIFRTTANIWEKCHTARALSYCPPLRSKSVYSYKMLCLGMTSKSYLETKFIS